MRLYVHTLDGNKTKSQVTLNDAVFAIEPNDYAIYQAVRLEEANKRQGTHMTKNILVVEDFTFDKPQTKKVVEILKAFELEGRKPMFITAELDRNFVKSANNIYGVVVREGRQFSTRDVLYAGVVVIQTSAVKQFNEVLAL